MKYLLALLLCRWPGGHSVLVGDAVHDGQTVKIEKGRIVRIGGC